MSAAIIGSPEGGPRRRQRVLELRGTVAVLRSELTRNGLPAWEPGNVSARLPSQDLMVIEPSGVSYDDLAADDVIVCDLDGEVLDGDLPPSSDTAVKAAVMCEDVARTVFIARQLGPTGSIAVDHIDRRYDRYQSVYGLP